MQPQRRRSASVRLRWRRTATDRRPPGQQECWITGKEPKETAPPRVDRWAIPKPLLTIFESCDHSI